MNANTIPHYQMIETGDRLENFAKTLEREKTVAVDLEADSMYHFKEKVCLVQMATRKENVVIDPLQVEDLSPLEPLFSRHDVKKIFHGADYDVRSLHRDFNIEINNLFDTQIACRFLGFRETGLNAVLREQFNISLNKKYQKKDWSKRPLPGDMIEYAAKDVLYLFPLARLLEDELRTKGRLAWVQEECEYLSKVRPASADGEPLYLRFKGAGRLSPRSLAVLENLLWWRKDVARIKDKPPFKIVGNDVILIIARSKPVNLSRLENIKALSRKQFRMYGTDIIEAIRKALEIPSKDLPVYPRKKGPVLSPDVPERVKALKRWRDAKARTLEIEPSLIFNKSLIISIALRNPRNIKELSMIKEMKTWQKEDFGEDIVAVLNKASR